MRHFRDLFTFNYVETPTLVLFGDALKAIRAHGIPGESLLFDSVSALYLKLAEAETSVSSTGKYTVNYANVNRRMLAALNLVFEAVDKNVIVTAHAAQKWQQKAGGGPGALEKAGLDIVADPKFRYAFDYIFRVEPTGPDPRTSPPKFIVEKRPAGVSLKIGQTIVGLDYAKFVGLTRGAAPDGVACDTRAQRPTADQPRGLIGDATQREIKALERAARVGDAEMAELVDAATLGRTRSYLELTEVEFKREGGLKERLQAAIRGAA
jgi:hypothetical protein